MDMKKAMVVASDKVEAIWNERIAMNTELTDQERETLNAQKELLMSHAGETFMVQVNQAGFARIGLPMNDKQLILLIIPLNCLMVLS